jgi:hypothetical protein
VAITLYEIYIVYGVQFPMQHVNGAVKPLARDKRVDYVKNTSLSHFCLDYPALSHERALAFHTIESAISSLPGGPQLWQWFNSKAGEKYSRLPRQAATRVDKFQVD